MAANGDRSKAELQGEIRKQGEKVRNLKQQEQTDEVKEQVSYRNAIYTIIFLSCKVNQISCFGLVKKSKVLSSPFDE